MSTSASTLNTVPDPTSIHPVKSLHIAVGLLRDGEGRVLISQRRPGTHGAGQWEFPGGKCEPDEPVEQALRRELAEELGITVAGARPFITVRHAYVEREVVLDAWLITEWQGQPTALEGQPLAWVSVAELRDWPLLEADVPIVQALELPDLYLFTGMAEPGNFLGRLQASLTGGLRLVRLRAPELGDGGYRRLANECLPLCRAAGARLLLDRDPEMVVELGADGLHLTSAHLMTASSRPLPMPYRVAASCHSAVELSHAQSIGVDFAVLSPVRTTASHPDARPLGWPGFRDLVRGRALPVYALGGLATGDLAEAWGQGARGVAAIRGLWAEAG